MSTKGKSPLKDRPLNLPGQSVDSALRDFADDHFILPLFLVLTLILMSVWEWFGYARNIPRKPVLFTVLAAAAVVAYAVYFRLRWPKAKAMKLGRDGERAVGQYFDSHVESDASVFHDVPSVGGNIDHVIICSRGIYAIETKTRTKPAKSDAIVTVEDGKLLVNGYAPARDPLIQAKACASDLTRLLEQSTGKRFAIQPVVVFPGWFVEDKRASKSPVWVLEPKALPSWIRNNAAVMSESDVCLATYHLSRHIRTAAP
jgi:hypothetical protein